MFWGLLNFPLIGHHTINLSEWNKIVHGKYVKRLSCPHGKKKKKKGKLKHHILPFSGSADHIRFHSSLIPVHFGIFRCHSGSFRCIPVPFLSIPFHFGVILPCSGIFRLIPVYSVPFNSVPVFSNARTFQKTCHVPCQAASCQKPTCHVAPRT